MPDSLNQDRALLADALNKMIETFVSHKESTFDEVMTNGIGPVADAAGIDRVGIYHFVDMAGALRLEQMYRWDRESGGTTPPISALNVLPLNQAAKRWFEVLSNDGYINSRACDLPRDEEEIVEMFGAKAIMMISVFTHGEFWGAVTLQNHTEEAAFDENCVDLLCSAARLCANAIIREEKTNNLAETMEALKASKNMMKTLNEAAVMFLEQSDKSFEEIMSDGIRMIVEMLDLSRMSVWRNFLMPDGTHTSQIFRWHGDSGGTTEPLDVFDDICYNKIMPRWETVMKAGDVINALAREMPEAETLAPFGCVSVFAAPLFIQNTFWGFVLFEDTRAERCFDENSVDIMRQAALLIANIVIRQEMESEIAAANDLNRTMIASSPLSFTIFDSDSNIVDCNDSTLNMFGCTREYYTDHFFDFSPEFQPDGTNSRDLAFEHFKAALNGERTTFEWMHRSAAGELIPAEITLALAKYKDRDLVLTFFYDLRSIKKMDEDLRVQSERLKEALSNVTAASKAKGDFLSNMSHEMRTPLNAIIGMTAIGKSADDIERKNYALNKVEDASAHLLGVINDVLDMSKIEANKLELSPIEFNFDKMLQKVITVINFKVEEKRQRLDISVGADVPRFVIGDDQRLGQVITNLLSNAVKFTPEGGMIRLNAFLINETEKETELRIEVRDNGIGISAEQQQKLFQAFGQAESGTSRKFGGTGLGLAISKRIVELMDGEIWVESELGKGSAFMFTFKVKRIEKIPRVLSGTSINWDNLHILVIDDDEITRGNFKNMFERLNGKCDVASNGEEACRMIDENGEYDIYFVDWMMPEMDGIALTGKIKNRLNDKASVVVMISSVDWTQIKDMAVDAGVDKYLLKPVLLSTVVDCLNDCLGIDDDTNTGDFRKEIQYRFEGKTILLAEDIEINREIVLLLLNDTGITIETAENGKEALKMIEANPDKFDLVLMDVQMPLMDGLEATRRIRCLGGDKMKNLPIIAMTANVFKEDIDECMTAGMDDHIGKPIDMDELSKKLRKYLGTSGV